MSLLRRGIISSGKLGGVAPPVGPISSLLLHMDGTNGSTTFTDSASPSNTVAANDNAELSTTGAKFGTACGLFDGAGDFIDLAAPNFEFGASDFCIDFWLNNTDPDGLGTFEFRFANDVLATTRDRFELGVSGGGGAQGKLTFEYFKDGALKVLLRTSGLLGSGSYQHVAITREGSTWRMFVDGVLEATDTDSSATNDLNLINFMHNSWYSNYTAGRMDELRIVIGDAVYTSNFTPPTNPYTS